MSDTYSLYETARYRVEETEAKQFEDPLYYNYAIVNKATGCVEYLCSALPAAIASCEALESELEKYVPNEGKVRSIINVSKSSDDS